MAGLLPSPRRNSVTVDTAVWTLQRSPRDLPADRRAPAAPDARHPVAAGVPDWQLKASLESAATWVADSLQLDPQFTRARLQASMTFRKSDLSAPHSHSLSLFAERIFTTALGGIGVGLTAILMQASIDSLMSLRNAAFEPLIRTHLLAACTAALAGGVALVVAAAALVQFVAPRAAGGGVTLLMAALNGLNIPDLFSTRVYLVKLLGCVLARVSSMCMGVEAPMVLLGAVVTGLEWNLICKLRRWWRGLPWGLSRGGGYQALPSRSRIEVEHGDEDELLQASLDAAEMQELVSAGAAAGIAAAFFSPVGGVLFSWEEASSIWNRRVAWRALTCAAVAVGTHWVVQPSIAWHGIWYAQLEPAEWLRQVPLIIVVSAGAGLMGAAFNAMRLALRPLRAPAKRHARRLAEAALLAVVTLVLTQAAALLAGTCLSVPAGWEEDGVVRLRCPQGQYNDLGTLLLGRGMDGITKLMALGSSKAPMPAQECSWSQPCYFTPLSLGMLAACYLLLMPLSATALAVPGGLFMPSILAGGAFGALASQALAYLLPSYQLVPGMYALYGATAMLGAVFRSSLSLAVVMVEASGNLQCGGAILLSIFVSNAVAKICRTAGMYESEIDHDSKLFYLPQEPPPEMHWKTAGDLMAMPVVGLPTIVPVQTVLDLLRFTRHNAFPVFGSGERDPMTGMGRLDGFILRGQLQLLLDKEVFCDSSGFLLRQPSDLEAYEQGLAAELGSLEPPCEAASSADMAVHGGSRSSASQGLDSTAALVSSSPADDLASPFEAGAQLRISIDGRLASSAGVTPHVNLAPFYAPPTVVRQYTPAVKVWRMFLSLSLRHLWVVDERMYLQGVITRKDLLT